MRRAALCLFLSLAAPLAAQQTVRDRLAGRVPPEVIAAVEAATAQAAVEGLPTEPLVQKALEGAAKGIAADRVIAAVEQLATRLAVAGMAVRVGPEVAAPPPTAPTIEAGTFALTAGLNEAEVHRVAAAAPSETERGPALRAAATLAALGVPGRETVDLVVAALQAGQPPAELLTLPQQVQGRMAQGQTPAQAAAGLARAAATSQGRVRGEGPPPERPRRQNPHRP